MKKTIVLSLALVLSFCLAVPALAAESAPVLLSRDLALTGCTCEFRPGEDENNEGSVGMMSLSFTVSGPENAKDVLIASWQSEPYTPSDAQESAAFMVGIWKNGLSWTPSEVPPYESGGGFPIYADYLGEALYVLVVAIDENIDAVGYAVIKVDVPEGGDPGAGEEPEPIEEETVAQAARLLTPESGRPAAAAALLQRLVGIFGLNG